MDKKHKSQNQRSLKIMPFIILLLVAVLAAAIYQAYYQSLSPTQRAVRAYAREHGYTLSDYPESLVALLTRNPETESFVLEYPFAHSKEYTIDLSPYANAESVPLFLQWDQRWGYIPYGSDVAALTGCGPVCLAMAGFYVTGDDGFSPDKMLRFSLENGYYSPGNGSSWTLISEGGPQLGLDVTEIPLDKDRIFRNLEVDNPIICVMGPGDFTSTGHYIVMVGCENDKIRINDPNSIANSQKLWSYEDIKSQIRNLWVIRQG